MHHLFRSKCQSQAQPCHTVSLGKRLENNQIGILVKESKQAGLFGKVDVGFIDNHHATKAAQDLLHLREREAVARRVVGRTKEEQLAVVVGPCQQGFDGEGEIVVQLHLAHLHVVDVCCHTIHAVAGTDGNGIVNTRRAEDAEAEVDGFVAAVTNEDVCRGNALEGGDVCLECFLTWVGVAVVAVVVGILVGIEEDADVALVLIAGGRVRGEGGNVGTNKG